MEAMMKDAIEVEINMTVARNKKRDEGELKREDGKMKREEGEWRREEGERRKDKEPKHPSTLYI